MKKITSLFLIFCICSSYVISQDKLAVDILDKLSEKTKGYTSIQIEFDYIFTNKSYGINEKSSGTLDIQGDNFRIDIPEQLIINNGSTHWIYLKEMQEVQIMEYDSEEEDAFSPNRLFNLYKEDYKNAYVEQKTIAGKNMHVIDLFPKESGPIMKIRLTISDLKIQILALHDKNGGIYTYNIKSFSTNIELKPFMFNTNKYPEIEVIDLR